MGREFVAVPAVLVRSKILRNNLGRTFLPPEAITPEWAETANGRPAVNIHPKTTANSPAVLNENGIGFLFNAKAEGDALKADVFLDPDRAGDVPDLTAILAKLEAGEKVEVSTGFPVRVEDSPGALNGEEYDVVIHPAGFDHLAVFAKQIGACSVSDGCGLAQNHEGPCAEEESVDEETEGRLAGAINKLVNFLGGQTAEEEAEEEVEGANNSEEDGSMNRENMIAQLAAGGTDKDALAKLSDCQLKALLNAEAGGGEETTELPPERPDDSEAMRLAHQYRREAEELKAKYEPARQGLEKERAELLDDLLYNVDALPYSTAEIKAMDIVEMRKIHKLACPKRADFSGRGGPVSNAGSFDWVEPVLSKKSIRNEQEVH